MRRIFIATLTAKSYTLYMYGLIVDRPVLNDQITESHQGLLIPEYNMVLQIVLIMTIRYLLMGIAL